MKKVTVLVVVLMFAVAAWAYQGSYGSSTKASTPSKTSTASAGPKESTMTGCLSGPNAEGAYLLENRRHRKGMEVGSMDDLKGHVGHKVKLTGTWAKEGSEIGETEAKGEKEGREKHFKVSKVAMIAETCTVPKPAATKTK
jgi:hypothetical protein